MARRKVDPTQQGTAAASIRVIETGHQATLIFLDLFNTSVTDDIPVEVYFVPSGGTAGEANQILDYSMAPKETRGFIWQQFLRAGDFIAASAGNGGLCYGPSFGP